MKSAGVLLVFWLGVVGVVAQGQFYFTNRDPSAGVGARFVLPSDLPGTSSVGTDFQVSLWGSGQGSPVDRLFPLEPAIDSFRGPAGSALAGYVIPITVTVPGVPIGGEATVLVRVYNGESWDRATYRFEGLFTTRLGGDPTAPPTLPLGNSQLLVLPVPEARLIWLWVLGVGFLCATAAATQLAGARDKDCPPR